MDGQVGPDDTLRHVVDELMRHNVTQLPVLHYPAHALVPELLHLACLSGILRCTVTSCYLLFSPFLSFCVLSISFLFQAVFGLLISIR